MIISASRRTDIPAFHAEWFLGRLNEGTVEVPNPMNSRQVRQVSLKPDDVDCLVFWSKNPEPLLPFLGRLQDFPFYFLYTLNSYSTDLEPYVPPRTGRIDTFRRLADKIGKEAVIWRYDPIIFSPVYTAGYHLENFGAIARQLSQATDTCIISFLDIYRKNKKRLASQQVMAAEAHEMNDLAAQLQLICRECGLKLHTCCEKEDFSALGISPASCIDPKLVSRITGHPYPETRDRNQRPGCHCAVSVDIGRYNTCRHDCLYCYANAKM